MDTGKTYIKMCERVPKIQEQAPDSTYVQWVATLPKVGYQGENVFGEGVWLPTQAQLQAMLLSSERDFIELLEEFYWEWAGYKTEEKHPWREQIETEDKVKIREDFTSMEQLWLAFVMKEKYNKVWADGDWKEIE